MPESKFITAVKSNAAKQIDKLVDEANDAYLNWAELMEKE